MVSSSQSRSSTSIARTPALSRALTSAAAVVSVGPLLGGTTAAAEVRTEAGCDSAAAAPYSAPRLLHIVLGDSAWLLARHSASAMLPLPLIISCAVERRSSFQAAGSGCRWARTAVARACRARGEARARGELSQPPQHVMQKWTRAASAVQPFPRLLVRVRRGRRCTPASCAGHSLAAAGLSVCERRAAGWRVPAEPTMLRRNSQVLGFED